MCIASRMDLVEQYSLTDVVQNPSYLQSTSSDISFAESLTDAYQAKCCANASPKDQVATWAI